MSKPSRSHASTAASPAVIALLSIDDASSQTRSVVPLRSPLFSPTPALISFDKYEPFKPVRATLLLTNNDHVSRRVKVEQPKDHHFKIISTSRPGLSLGGTTALGRTGNKSLTAQKAASTAPPSKDVSSLLAEEKESSAPSGEEMGSSKIAPGMGILYTIEFTPRDRADYSCDLVCTTEREQFLIPIRARGDRPSLDMPESLEFGVAPVYHSTVKPILIRNDGRMPAQFSFSVVATEAGADESAIPFSVEPAHGVLAVEETVQVLVSFTPAARGAVEYRLIADLTTEGGAASDAAAGSSPQRPSNGTSTGFVALSAPLSPPIASVSSASSSLARSAQLPIVNAAISNDSRVSYSTRLTGEGQDVNVELEASLLTADPTYVGLRSQKTVLLHNHSDIPISFHVKQRRTRQEDSLERDNRFQELQAMEQADRADIHHVVEKMREERFQRESRAAHRRHRDEVAAARREAGEIDDEESKLDAEAEESFDEFDEVEQTTAEEDDGEMDPEERSALEYLRAEQHIVRKYRALYRALESDTLASFSSPYYSVEPMDGEIWPKGSKEITVTFSPDAAGLFEAELFIQVSGRFERIPLKLKGLGLGPEARFSYSTMDIGSVYMNAPHKYEITLQNIGNIPCSWRIRPDKLIGGQGVGKDHSRFSFTPSHGTLQVTPAGKDYEEELDEAARESATDRVKITVDFISGHIGDFVETIFFELIGNNDPLKLIYKGKVIGPTFYLDQTQIDYGVISYGFLNSRHLTVHNTSAIDMKLRLHIDQDGAFIAREFGFILAEIVPEDSSAGGGSAEDDTRVFDLDAAAKDLTAQSGNVVVIPAYSRATIQVDLISESADKVYHDKAAPYELLLDVEGVGENLIALPIKAQCLVPMPTVVKDLIPFETVFLRHTYEQFIPLRNDTDLFAKFEVVSQDEHSKSTVILEPETYTANVAPHSTFDLKVLLTAHRLGSFQQPFYVQIPGSTAIPYVIHATFLCRGPKVLLDSKSLNFGQIPALTPIVKSLILTNDSPIKARFKAFVHKKNSCYSLDISKGTMPPFSKQVIQVTAYLNETLPMNDQLHVIIEEGDDLTIPLRAQGSGTTVATTLSEGMNVVEFGDQLTNTPISREFRLENRGRRTQILQWERVPDLPPAHSRTAASSSSDSKSPERAQNPLDILGRVARMKRLGNDDELAQIPEPTFAINPPKITLEPNTAMVFTLSGESAKAGPIAERWICKALIGQAKKLEIIYDSSIRANFITPLLSFSSTSLSFTQMLDPKTPLVLSEPQQLTLTNRTALPLKFRLKVPLPFAATVSDFLLEAGASGETVVKFIPDLNEVPGQISPYNKTSVKIKQDLTVVYTEHPQRDKLVLFGDLCYPNLSFSSNKVDFGSILNDTSKRVLLTITNHSAIESTYRWFFSDKQFGKSEVTSRASSRIGTPKSGRRVGTPNPTLKMGTDASSLPLNELFDILPIRGSLKPGESETVEFTFYGHQEMKVQGVALCEVEGGPDYEIKLKGEASSVSYSLDCTQIQFSPHEVNFGPQDIFSTSWKEVILSNDGRVAFDFKSLPPEEGVLPLIECVPPFGRLNKGEKAKLQVRFLSARPDTLEGDLLLQVGCFDPVPIHLSAAGVLPALQVELPTAQQWLEQSPNAPQDAPALDSTQEFSVARYVADLGHIIKNTVQELKFTIRNVGPIYASYTIDKKAFASSIFTIEPTMVTRVPPGESTTFTITCRASNPTKNKIKKIDIFEGREFMYVGVPIAVRNGPPMLLHVCAHITVPDVEMSQTKLDFGKVLLNQRREITIQLHNTKAVPAVWAFSNPVGSNVRDKDCYELRPSSGTLEAGKKVNVTIAYTPSLLEERKSVVRIPFKVEQNPKLIQIMATGQGVSTQFSFDRAVVGLPTCLPYSATTATPFQLVNHSSHPIEVFSLDFDEQYLREESILAGDEGFNDPLHPDLLFLPPRVPGEGLPADLVQRAKIRAKKAKRLEDEQRQKALGDQQVGSLVDASLVADATGAGGVASAAAAAATASGVDLPQGLTSELVRNLLLIGAPYSGKTALAKSLLSLLELKPHQLITIDNAVRYFFELEEKEAEENETFAIREKEYEKDREKTAKRLSKEKKLALDSAELKAAVLEEIGPLDNNSVLQVTPEERTLAHRVHELIAAARTKKALELQEAAIAAKNAKRSGSSASQKAAKATSTASPPDSARAKGATSPRTLSKTKSLKNTAALPGVSLYEPDAEMQDFLLSRTFFDLRDVRVLSEEDLAEIVYRYLLIQKGATFAQGVIIDGLENSFTLNNPAEAARAVRNGFAKLGELTAAGVPQRDNNLHILTLDVSRSEAFTRMASVRAQAKALVDDEALQALLKKFKVLSPRDLEKLPEAKRAEYERTLDAYSRRKEAEFSLYQIDHVDPARFDGYWKEEAMAIEAVEAQNSAAQQAFADAQAAAAAATAATSQSASKSNSRIGSAVGHARTSSSSSVSSVTPLSVAPIAPPEMIPLPTGPFADPLVEILSALDLPAFASALDMPAVLLPEPEIDSEAEAVAKAEEEARLKAEAEAKEAEEAKAKEEADAAATRKGKRMSNSNKKSTSPSPARGSSADGRKGKGAVEGDGIPPPPLPPAWSATSQWDDVPVRISAMNGLPSVKFIKLRRFESVENLPRILKSTLSWIEEPFRIELDPRSLDPDWIPPPATYQIIPRPGLRVRRHQKTQGFVLVDPEIEAEMAAAKKALEEEQARKAAEEAAAAEEEAKKKGAKKGSAGRQPSPDATSAASSSASASAAAIAAIVPSRSVATRWIIAPHSAQTVFVSFTSTHVGSFASRLGFEVVGGHMEYEVGTSALCAVPEIANDPRSIFMKRPKSSKPGIPQLSKAYLANEKVFDFGPILIGKDPDNRHLPAGSPIAAPTNGLVNNESTKPLIINGLVLTPLVCKKTNADVWRISNAGPFATHVDLSFLNGIDSTNAPSVRPPSAVDAGKKGRGSIATSSKRATTPTKADRSASPSTGATPRKDDDKGKKGASAKKGSAGLSEKDLKALEKQRELDRAAEDARWEVLRSKRVFIVEPCSFDLGVDESRDITVWAFPQATATFEDTLIATIKDNPQPVQLPMRCTGAKPGLNLSTSEVTFDRMLLSQQESRTFEIVNTGNLPVAWSIAGLENMPDPEILSIGPVTQGILLPGSPPLTLTVAFTAKEEKAFHIPLTVEARDVEGFLGVLDSIPLTIRCESYQNKAHLDFGASPAGSSALNSEVSFDLIRVGDWAEQVFHIVNEGLYEVRYKLVVPSSRNASAFNSMFSLTPQEGVLPANHKQEIVLQFRADREFQWKRDTSLKLYLYESNAVTATKRFDVPVTASAQYSKFHLLPSSTVNFGPIEAGVPANRTVVLHNDGAFEFEYRFYSTNSSHVYSRSSVFARADEKEKAEAAGGKGSRDSASSSKKGKKDASDGFRLGSKPKPAVAPPAPVASAPVPLSGPADGKKGKGDKKGPSTTTPRDRSTDRSPHTGRGSSAGDRNERRSTSNGPSATPKGVSGGAKGKGAKGGEQAIYDQPPELEVGPFILRDPCGWVAPGKSIELDLSLYSEASHQQFIEGLELEVSGANPEDEFTRYELQAESETPGLDTQNVRAIFEEHEVRIDLAQAKAARKYHKDTEGVVQKDVYAQRENVFCFAPVIVPAAIVAAQTAVPATPMSPRSARGVSPKSPKAGDASPKKPSSPSPESRSARNTGSNPSSSRSKKPAVAVETPKEDTIVPLVGRTARFRIANPYKVASNVSLFLHATQPAPAVIVSPSSARESKDKKGSKNAAAAGMTSPASSSKGKKDKDKDVPAPVTAFTLSDSAFTLQPSEHRYVEVTFKPDAVQSYSTFFEAVVDAGLDVATRSLLFEIRGEGTTPVVTVVAPTVKDEEQRPLLDFNRLFHGSGASTATRTVTLRNEGLVPTTARFDLLVKAPGTTTFQLIPSTSNSFFGFSARGKLVTLSPGESQSFEASFTPQGVGLYAAELRMSIVSNPSGGVSFTMRGESYMQDITLEAAGLETIPLLAPAAPAQEEVKEKEKSRSRNAEAAVDVPVTVPLITHLSFPDASIGQPVSQVLTLVNHSDLPYRFSWSAPMPPGALEAQNTKRGAGRKSEIGGASDKPGSKKKEKELEEEKKRAEEEAKRRASDGSAAAANALALALAESLAAAGGEFDPLQPDFTFTPSIGHLPPHSSKRITLTFRSAVVRQYTQVQSFCTLQRIRYLTPEQIAARGTEGATKKERSSSAEKRPAGTKKGAEEEKTPTIAVEPVSIYLPSNCDWDNSQTIVKWLTEDEARARADAAKEAKEAKKDAKKKTTSSSGKHSARGTSADSSAGDSQMPSVQVTDTAPEPVFELVDQPVAEEGGKRRGAASSNAAAGGSDSARGRSNVLSPSSAVAASSVGSTITSLLDIRLSAVADVSRYELALQRNAVYFRPTFMYQTRVFNFVLTNPASTKLAYQWQVAPVAASSPEDYEEPFSITPARGSIAPKQSQSFTVKFSPLSSRDYRTVLKAIIPDLNPNQAPPSIELRGSSLRPKCHFELAPSDYLTAAGKRPAQFPPLVGDAASGIRVLEFKSLGVRVKNVRKFYVVNPTDKDYAFSWKCDDEAGKPSLASSQSSASLASPSSAAQAAAANAAGTAFSFAAPTLTPRTTALALKSPFKCLTPKGVIEAGRKFEMIFEYVPQVEVASESRWRFIIPTLEKDSESKNNDDDGLATKPPQALEVAFLLAGCVSQPTLELDRTFVNFHSLIAGQKRTETVYLTNVENAAFAWSVDRSSITPEMEQNLTVSPSSGIVTANSKFAIELTLRPQAEQSYNFNLFFTVKHKPTKLAVNIKGQGFALVTDLFVIDGNEEAERERRQELVAQKAAKEAEAVAAAAAALLAEQQNSKSARGSAGKKRAEASKSAAAAAVAAANAVAAATAAAAAATPSAPLSPSSGVAQGPPVPEIPLGGLSDVTPLGLDLDSAVQLSASSSSSSSITSSSVTSMAASNFLRTHGSSANRLDFGLFATHTRKVKHLLLRNSSKFNVDFKIQYNSNPLFKIIPAAGQVLSGHTMLVEVIGGSREEASVSAAKATVYVAGIKNFSFSMSGTTNRTNRFALLHK